MTQRIAVVGAGISGLSAAWGLRKCADGTLFEQEARVGGHSATVDVAYDGTTIPVDTGFIVYNTLNYPNLTAFFEHLRVPTKASDMSFSVSIGEGKLEWAGSDAIWKVFAQPQNIVNPRFLFMLREIFRFNQVSVDDMKAGRLAGLTMGAYLSKRGFAERFQRDYLVPMGAAIWSTSVDRMLQFPAESFVAFFDNHRLLGFKRPVWRTVDGGSQVYVERLLRDLGPRLRRATPVTRVERANGQVLVTAGGETQAYDAAILAGHSDQSLAILADATPAEQSVLADIRYQANDVWLHRDPSLMPRRKAAWASWNYLSRESAKDLSQHVSVTYWMNLLQGIDRRCPLFVSLNPPVEPRADLVFGRFSYAHPQLDTAALAAQRRLPDVQGSNRVYFAGAWTGYGFHEDGLSSGIRAAEALGGHFPWRPRPPEPIYAVAAE
jgi:predicted NAD/FAD-binding protein